MTTNDSIGHKQPIDNIVGAENNEQFGLRIPLGKEILQIALSFASEQVNLHKGKQVFFNTLAVVAVHKCLNWFGFQSYLDSGDCWNSVRRSMFSVADLLVQDWGRIECFPIFTGQDFIELLPDLLEYRSGCVGVKFHQHLNYVEMYGFKIFDQITKSRMESNLKIYISELQPFHNIFYYLNSSVPSPICGPGWKTFEELGRRRLVFASSSDSNKPLDLSGKIINLGDDKIIFGAALESIDTEFRNVFIRIYNYNKNLKLPKNLTITVLDKGGEIDGLNRFLIGDNYCFEMTFRNFILGSIFTLIFSCNEVQICSQFIIES